MAIKDADDGVAVDPIAGMAVIGPVTKATQNLIAGWGGTYMLADVRNAYDLFVANRQALIAPVSTVSPARFDTLAARATGLVRLRIGVKYAGCLGRWKNFEQEVAETFEMTNWSPHLGQVTQYMEDLDLKHAFLSNYRETVFLRQALFGRSKGIDPQSYTTMTCILHKGLLPSVRQWCTWPGAQSQIVALILVYGVFGL